jgi:hypothetical protein
MTSLSLYKPFSKTFDYQSLKNLAQLNLVLYTVPSKIDVNEKKILHNNFCI